MKFDSGRHNCELPTLLHFLLDVSTSSVLLHGCLYLDKFAAVTQCKQLPLVVTRQLDKLNTVSSVTLQMCFAPPNGVIQQIESQFITKQYH
ncbi:hypothetical protein J6590_006621 [Homalodisca vitripennis]|nr:hypothetical protein J6590_006621 [Homalodisca vitripennis]